VTTLLWMSSPDFALLERASAFYVFGSDLVILVNQIDQIAMNKYKLTLALMACVLSTSAQVGIITWEVNMANEEVSPEGVFLAGGDYFGVPGDNPMSDDDGDGIWTITLAMPLGYSGAYTFTNGACADWSCKENIIGQECAYNEWSDRFLPEVTSAGATITTCFSLCSTDGSCEEISGCTYANACNYDSNANTDDGSCEYESCVGCMDVEACNFDAEYSIASNDECTYPGCLNPLAINFDFDAGCPSVCVYSTFDCGSIGNAAWQQLECVTDSTVVDVAVITDIIPIVDSLYIVEWDDWVYNIVGYDTTYVEVEVYEVTETCDTIYFQDLPMGVFPNWQEAMVGVEWSGEWVFNIPEMVEEPQSGFEFGVHHVDWISFEGLPNWIEESDFALGELTQSSQHCITATGIPTEQGITEFIATGEVFISLFGEEFSIGEQSFSAILEVIDNPNLVPGCTYMNALNYVNYAEIDDGSCLFAGCTDESAGNYSPIATIDDGSCVEPCSPSEDSSCPTDISGDGLVNVSDLLLLLSDFGAECIIEIIEFTCGDPFNYQSYDYATVQIGEQCWFADNLRSELYTNGDIIASQLSDSEWTNTTVGASAAFGENPDCPDYYGNACDVEWSVDQYGRLYNGYAIADIRGLCPLGWHIPSDDEWITLEIELGMSEDEVTDPYCRGTDQGHQLKATYGWNDTSWFNGYGGNGSNSSGFSGLPGGYRANDGGFHDAGSNLFLWSSNSHERMLEDSTACIYRLNIHSNMGASVRCLKDSE